MQNMPPSYIDLNSYKPKWQERFAFYEQYGGPHEAAFKAAFKALPMGKRILLNMNFIAFFTGPIYLFALGLWKKNIALLAICLAVGVVAAVFESVSGVELSPALNAGINGGIAAMWGVSTNYAYYLKEVKGQQGWNPFEK